MRFDVKAANKLYDTPGFADLASDFKKYVFSGKKDLPHYFGKDVPYLRPPGAVDADLWHLHLKQGSIEDIVDPPRYPWDPAKTQHKRTSNKWLVYTRSFRNPNCYIILTIIFPDAHGLAEQRPHMDGLIELAERARAAY